MIAATVHVTGFDLVKINGTVDHVAPGGAHPLCQAIPVTTVTARVRWSALPTPATLSTRLTTPAGHRGAGHVLRARTRAGHGAISFTPRGEHLPGEAFATGRYTVSVRRAGRIVARATLRFTMPSSAC